MSWSKTTRASQSEALANNQLRSTPPKVRLVRQKSQDISPTSLASATSSPATKPSSVALSTPHLPMAVEGPPVAHVVARALPHVVALPPLYHYARLLRAQTPCSDVVLRSRSPHAFTLHALHQHPVPPPSCPTSIPSHLHPVAASIPWHIIVCYSCAYPAVMHNYPLLLPSPLPLPVLQSPSL